MRVYSAKDKARLYHEAKYLDNGCIIYGRKLGKGGYGCFSLHDDKGKHTTVTAHKAAWEMEHGFVTEGFVLDHECHDPLVCKLGKQCPHRGCINPKHMVVTTRAVNSSAARIHSPSRDKTHCKNGHEFTPQNIYSPPGKQVRACRECRRIWANKYNQQPEVRSRQNAWRTGNPKVLARRRELRAAHKTEKA